MPQDILTKKEKKELAAIVKKIASTCAPYKNGDDIIEHINSYDDAVKRCHAKMKAWDRFRASSLTRGGHRVII